MRAVDRTLDWLAYHPLPTVIGLIAIAVAVGSGWFYTSDAPGLVPNALLAATVVAVIGAFLLGMYIRDRLEVEA